MSDYLSNLIARSRGKAAAIEPRLPSRFEPASPGLELPIEELSTDSHQPTELQRSIDTSVGAPQSTVVKPAAGNQFRDLTREKGRGDSFEVVSDAAANRSEVNPELANAPGSLAPQPNVTITKEKNRDFVDDRKANVLATIGHPAIDRLRAPADTKREQLESTVIEPAVISALSAAESSSQMANVPALPSSTPGAAVQESRPTIRVNIGRVEVRAIQMQQPTPKPRQRRVQPPVLSLNEYLNRRTGGSG